jgi:Amt family ammonium transporter
LVAVTPAAGVVPPLGALVLGVAASCICYFAIVMKTKLGYDDSLDAFGVHGVGGTAGAILLAFFIRNSWFDVEGWTRMDQLFVQIKAVGIAIGYAAVMALILAVIVDKTIGLRASDPEEVSGLDQTFHGEQGYGMLSPEGAA